MNVLVLDRLLVNHFKLFFIAKFFTITNVSSVLEGCSYGKLEHGDKVTPKVGITVLCNFTGTL